MGGGREGERGVTDERGGTRVTEERESGEAGRGSGTTNQDDRLITSCTPHPPPSSPPPPPVPHSRCIAMATRQGA